MDNISTCCTCGHSWRTGTNGSHSCVDTLIKAARAALEALEGQSVAGAIEIYRFPAVLALHDVVFNPERLDEAVRMDIRAEAELNPPES
jgi:hypothetical protein